MTDEELIARLRVTAEWVIGKEAADRIEALVKERERLDAGWHEANVTALCHAARAERLEAAMREIESISVHSGGEVHGVTADHWRMAFEQAQDVARAALKGEDHE